MVARKLNPVPPQSCGLCLSLDFGNKSINFKLLLFLLLLLLGVFAFSKIHSVGSSLLEHACAPVQSQMTLEMLCVAQIFNLGFECPYCLDPVYERESGEKCKYGSLLVETYCR